MYTIQQTDTFRHWLDTLRDFRAKTAIVRRLYRAHRGNLGDVKHLGHGLLEMRVDVGQGYRVYFLQQGMQLVILLCGGDKSTQSHDIDHARELAKEFAS